jgi:LEA14-like dessication related protein
MPLYFFRSATFLLLILLCSLLFSCSTPKALEYREFKNLTIQKLGFATSTVTMDIMYYNPNNYGLQVKRADLDIYLNNIYAGHATQEYQITIPKLAEFNLPVQVDVDMKNILKNTYVSLLNSQVMLKVTGTVKVGKANIFISFPVNYEGAQTYNFFN